MLRLKYDMSVGKKGHVFFALQLAMVFIFMAVLGITITSGDRFIGERDTLLDLLEGYRAWYAAVFFTTAILAVAAVVLNVLIIVSVKKTENAGPQHIWGGLFSIIAVLAMMAAVAIGDNLQEYARWAAADIAALESGELAVIQIDSLTGTGHRTGLPEPRGGNQPNHLLSFQVRNEAGQMVNIYVVEEEYEQIRGMIQEMLTAQVAYGNEIGSHRGIDTVYLVRYTPWFNIVAEITPVKIGW